MEGMSLMLRVRSREWYVEGCANPGEAAAGGGKVRWVHVEGEECQVERKIFYVECQEDRGGGMLRAEEAGVGRRTVDYI